MMSSSAPSRIPTFGTTSHAVLSSWGLFVAILLVMIGSGVLNPLIGLNAELQGFSTTTTGIVLSFYYVGFLVGAWLTPRMVVNVGHIRVYAALASLASTSTLVYIVNSSATVWAGARLITGFAMSGLVIVAESWLNDATTNRTRGRLLAAYMVVLMGGLALGQLLLIFADPSGIGLFIVASVAISLAVIPITLSTAPGPRFVLSSNLPISQVWQCAPVGLAAALGQGTGVAALLSLAALYGVRTGMSVDRTALFLALAVLGSVVLQGPIGVLSDYAGRRRVMLSVALLCAGVCALVVVLEPMGWAAPLSSFVVGGLAMTMYPLALSHINDRVPPGSAVGVSGLVSLATGVGAILGPVGGAAVMDTFGAGGLFVFVGIVYSAIAAFTLLRVLTHEGVPVRQRRAFTMIPGRAGTIILYAARRARRAGNRPAEQPSHSDPTA